MIWSILILLSAALSVESYGVRDEHERLAHGRQLKIYLPKTAEKLEFTPSDQPGNTILYWSHGHTRGNKGRVTSTGSDRRWYIDKVVYEDEGTYTTKDYWNKELSNVKVAVETRYNFEKCVAGESLYISLEGIDLADALLSFTGEYANVTLVRNGARVSQDLPDYFDRVKTHSMKIEITHVNFTDEGRYILKDRKDRVVSITRMDLTDKHEYEAASPLLALLLLLGIPAGICCCCRKKIFKKKESSHTVVQTTTVHESVHPPPGGPVGPAPPYNTGNVYYQGPGTNMGPTVHPPTMPSGPGQWNGPPPSPGFNPTYPPQNPGYPPQNPGYPPQNAGYPPQNPGYPPQNPGYAPVDPAMMHPAQPPQWNGPPQGQYPPGPTAPMGYAPAPVMYSSAPPAANSEPFKEEVKMQNMASDPLLSATPEAGGHPEPPPSSDGAQTFNIHGGTNSSTNFL